MRKAAIKKSNKTKKPKRRVGDKPFQQWLDQKLRSVCQKWPPYYGTRNRYRQEVHITHVKQERERSFRVYTEEGLFFFAHHSPKLGRRIIFECEQCATLYLDKDYVQNKNGSWRRRTMVAVDHVEPVVPITGFVDWNTEIARMFPQETGGFQCLCVYCHAKKSAEEAGQRAEFKRKEKQDVISTGEEVGKRSGASIAHPKPRGAGSRTKKSTRRMRRT